LIVSYYFPPTGGGGVQRWTKFIKYLSRMGWRFTVISADSGTRIPEDTSLLLDIPEDTKLIRIAHAEPAGSIQKQQKETPYWKRWLSAFIYITDSRKKWNSQVFPVIIEELDQDHYDVVIITIPPYSLAELAARLTLGRNEPVILDMRDPWSTNPYKIYPTIMHRLIDRGREVQAIRNVKYLISAYYSVLNYYSRIIPRFEQKKSVVVSNGYDRDDLPDVPEIEETTTKGFNIAFSGTFYSHLNHPQNLFKAIQLLNSQGKDIHFYHIGKSAYDLITVAEKYNISNVVHQTGYLTHAGCLKQLQTMDAFVLILDDRIKNADQTIGGKIYEYMALRKPILALIPNEGEAAALIRDTDSGIICPNSDINGIVESLKELITGKRKYNFKNIDRYNREELANQISVFLEEVMLSD
jgi:glycosyltransferase involved in cell wall biosynthesis